MLYLWTCTSFHWGEKGVRRTPLHRSYSDILKKAKLDFPNLVCITFKKLEDGHYFGIPGGTRKSPFFIYLSTFYLEMSNFVVKKFINKRLNLVLPLKIVVVKMHLKMYHVVEVIV